MKRSNVDNRGRQGMIVYAPELTLGRQHIDQWSLWSDHKNFGTQQAGKSPANKLF